MSQQEHTVDFITTRFGDDVIYEVNRTTFDAVDSGTLYRKQYGDLFTRPDTLFVVLGTDSGLLMQWIAREQRAPGSRFVFIELPELLGPVRQRYGEMAEEAGFALSTAKEWLDLSENLRFSDYAYLGNFKLVSSLAVRDANLHGYSLLESEVATQAGDFKRDIELQLGSYAFIRRQIENIADNLLPATLLENSQSGRTAVILGGGPSLDVILPWVERHREQVTVIAVSRIAKRLLSSSVQPDIVVSIDPHPVSFDVSKEALQFPNRPLLVCSNHVSPLLLGQWPGPSVYRGDRFPWPSNEDKENLFNAGPTVTNQAIAMAVDMGFARVILGGVDLCFSPQGFTHASGSNEHHAGPRLGQIGRQVETYSGRLADTDPPFAQAIEVMGKQAGAALERGLTLVNPFPDAAKVDHIKHIPLSELEVPDAPANGATQDIHILLERQTRLREKALASGRRELLRARGQLRQIRNLCTEALECNEHLFGRGGKQADFRYKKRMDRIERKLDREYAKLTPLVKQIAAAGFLSLLRPDENHEWSDEEIHAWGKRYYEMYSGAVDELDQLTATSIERIASRQEELRDQPDLDRLLHQWRQDENPGRAVAYACQHPEVIAQARPEVRSAFGGMAQQFDTVLSENDTAQARSLQQAYNLTRVRGKLSILFRQQEHEELAQLAANLQEKTSDEARELTALALGYTAELEQRPDEAMGLYQSIVDLAAEQFQSNSTQAANPRLEDALRRMCYISLEQQDIQTALMILDALVLVSPVYQPQYAEALRMAGQLQQAVDVYTDYLHKVPSDLATMLKLGQLLQNAGAMQAARESYNYVLSQSPDNRVAQDMLNALARSQPSA